MDQRHLAGVGNIYANEALFAAGIDPSKPARRLTPDGPSPAARRDPADPDGGHRVERDDLPRLPHRHRRAGQFPARAAGLRPRGRAVPPLRHAADRYARDRRPHLRVLPPLPVVSRPRRRPAGRPAPLDRPRASCASGSARWRRTGPASIGWWTPRAGCSTSARPSGSAPGCSPISEPSIRTTRRRGSCTRRATSRWDYVPSEFAAYLGELRQIRPLPPPLQPPRQPDPPRGAHQDLGRPGAADLRRRDRGPRRRAAATGRSNRWRRTARGGADAQRSARPPRLRGDDAGGLRGPGRSVRPAAAGRRACATSSASAPGPAPAS